MMLFAFLVALIPSVYGTNDVCDNCELLAFYEALLQETKSGSCDYAGLTAPDCTGGAAAKQGAELGKEGCEAGGAARDALEQGQQSAVDLQKQSIETIGLTCDSAEPSADPSSGGGDVECTDKNKEATNKDGTPKYPQCQDGANPAPAPGPAPATGTTPSPTTADGSAANGIAYKFAIVVSAAFAYFLF